MSEDAETDEIEAELEADEAGTDEFGDDELEPEGTEAPDVAEASGPGAPTAGMAATAAGATPRRRGIPTPVAQRAPTQSELAVRVTDNASSFFVIATVAIFAAILAFGVLAGHGGLLTAAPAPTALPSVSAAPSVSASAAPSASATPS